MRFESLYPRLWSGERLHLLRIRENRKSSAFPALLLHGAVGNGRIFYTRRGTRLGPYLARNGFDVFVADFRGRGQSTPHVYSGACWGQLEIIREDIDLFRRTVRAIHPGAPQHWVAHSWGGVLVMSYLARFPQHAREIASLTLFGSKRCIRVWNLQKFFKVSLVWDRIAALAVRLHGYLPGPRYRLGSDDESIASYRACRDWAKPSEWIDLEDGFHYQRAIARVQLPPTRWYAAAADRCLGHPSDVRDFMAECGQPDSNLHLLGVAHGHSMDYNHSSMLADSRAETDIFPEVAAFLRKTASTACIR